MTTDSAAAAIAEVTMVKTMRNLFADELGDLADSYVGTGVPVMLRLLSQPDSPWWDDVTTTAKEARDDILNRSLAEALDEITTRVGSDMAGWQWGKIHMATFAHPLGSVQPLNLVFNAGPVGTPGDGFTPDNNSYNWKTFAAGTISSYRQIIDLSNFGNSISNHTVGQSGQPFSRHFSDFVANWAAVKHHPMLFAKTEVLANLEGSLVLTPR